jgi:hypothetical protein
MNRYRYDMRTAEDSGETRHPQKVILEWFPDACELEPMPISECWVFSAVPRAGAPAFIRDIGAKQ